MLPLFAILAHNIQVFKIHISKLKIKLQIWFGCLIWLIGQLYIAKNSWPADVKYVSYGSTPSMTLFRVMLFSFLQLLFIAKELNK